MLVRSLTCQNAVIATGGSVVLSEGAMRSLASRGTVVYLELDAATIVARIRDLATRGIVRGGSQSFEDVYRERCPLYERHAGVVVRCSGKEPAAIVAEIVEALRLTGP